uniref:Oligopeptide transporter 1 n=1 Tax=Panagrolaimus superbus TaxID=310955 RepID=A0A914YJW0_9BILA
MRRVTITEGSLKDEMPVERRRKEREPQPETWGEIFRAWPKTTLCIVSNEFCERFSYYGMRTVLTLYLLNVLKFSDNVSTVFFNGFTVLCYLTPLLGSIIADGYIGKFKTIFTVSILYAAGQIVLAFSSINNSSSPLHPALDLAGLGIIAFGTGGIKPCVASFGGDQFEPHQTRMLSLFFSVFYFSINAGSMISTFISPLFRSMSCLGQDSCYPLAFGIPAILMIVATIIFMLGSFTYKKPPPKENIFGEVARLMTRAICSGGNGPKRDHWLEKYLNNHRCETDPKCMELKSRKRDNSLCQKAEFIEDVKSLLRVVVMYLPVPMFWALYDQQGSVWLIQGIQMDCRLWGSTLLLPDQMQTLNAVLILAFIPLFQVIIYPIASKVVTLTPLRKMVAGGVVAALAFVVSGFIQLAVNKTLPDLPPSGNGYVSIMNAIRPGCNINSTMVQGTLYKDNGFPLAYNSSLTDDKNNNVAQMIKVGADKNIIFTFAYDCGNTPGLVMNYTAPVVDDGSIYNLIVSELGIVMLEVDPTKPTEGTGEFSLSLTMALNDTNYVGHMALCRVGQDNPCDPTKPADFYYYEVNYDDEKDTDLDTIIPYTKNDGTFNTQQFVSGYAFKAIRPGNWSLVYLHNLAKSIGMQSLKPSEVNFTETGIYIAINNQGGVYAALLTGGYDKPNYLVNQIVPFNTVSILWQIPQFVIITIAEILFSITGYEFAYSQAAPSMKALVQALWLLTTAVGDSIIVLIAVLDIFSDQAVQAFVYAGAMFVVIVIFALMSIFYYDYKYYTGEGEDDDDDFEDEDAVSLAQTKDALPYENGHGRMNKGFDDSWDERL